MVFDCESEEYWPNPFTSRTGAKSSITHYRRRTSWHKDENEPEERYEIHDYSINAEPNSKQPW